MSSTGRAGVRKLDDFYRTPDWCTDALDDILKSSRFPVKLPPKRECGFCDPCAGDGAIVHRLNWLGYENLSAVEIDEVRASAIDKQKCGDVVCANFLSLKSHHLSPEIHVFGTNPPFSIAQEVIEHCLRLRPQAVVANLLRVNFLGGKKRKTFFAANKCDVHVFSRRPKFAENITWQVSEKIDKKWVKAAGPFMTEHEANVEWRRLAIENPFSQVKVQKKKTSSDSCEYAWFLFYEGCQGRWYRIEV